MPFMNTAVQNCHDAIPAVQKRRSGFSIVELLVAVVILAIGVLALAGTSAIVLRQMTGARTQTNASQIASSRIEYMSGMDCAGLAASGSSTTPGVTESWTVKAADNGTIQAEVSVTIRGRTSPEVFRTVIACH
jgi:type IV pilus assembly protein PilV